jgi:hypothetical protein
MRAYLCLAYLSLGVSSIVVQHHNLSSYRVWPNKTASSRYSTIKIVAQCLRLYPVAQHIRSIHAFNLQRDLLDLVQEVPRAVR